MSSRDIAPHGHTHGASCAVCGGTGEVEERSYGIGDRYVRAFFIALCRSMGLAPAVKTRKPTAPVYVVASAAQHDALLLRFDALGAVLDARLADVTTAFVSEHCGPGALRGGDRP